MAATLITAFAIPHDAVGYNLTDSADFATLATGAGNGIKVVYDDSLIVVLKNDTMGAATFTFKLAPNSRITAYGGSLTSPTKVVAAGKTYEFRLENLFRNAADGMLYIECDVAGKVLVQKP